MAVSWGGGKQPQGSSSFDNICKQMLGSQLAMDY